MSAEGAPGNLENPGGHPLLHDGVRPGVEPRHGAPDGITFLVQEPEPVTLPGETDGLDGFVSALGDDAHDLAQRLQRLVYVLLGALWPRVVQLDPAALHREHLPVVGEGRGLHNRGAQVHTEDHLQITSPTPLE